MWQHRKITGGYRSQYSLHNDNRDYFDAAHIQVANNFGYDQIEVAMPLGINDAEHYPIRILNGVAGLPNYNKDIQSAKIWFKDIYHNLRHQKQLFKFIRILGTAWRYCEYKGFKLFCGRRLEEPLKEYGWKHETTSVMIIGERDWFCCCKGHEYKGLCGLLEEIDISCFAQSPFWQKKDEMAIRIQNDLANKGAK